MIHWEKWIQIIGKIIVKKIEAEDIKELLAPLLERVDRLRDTVDNRYAKLENVITSQKSEVSSEIHKLEETITLQQEELKSSFSLQIQENNLKVQQIAYENVELKWENRDLKE